MYDLLIVGGGPAGYAAAVRVRQLGGQALLVEAGKVGGTCLHRGCIPSKVLQQCAAAVEKSRYYQTLELLRGAVQVSPEAIGRRQQEVVSRQYDGLLRLLHSHRIQLLEGQAHVSAPGRVQVTDKTGRLTDFLAKSILLATGSREARLNFPGATLAVGAETSLCPPAKPCRVVVIGAGSTGLELASAYTALGFQVTVAEKEKQLLPSLDDEDVRQWLRFFLKKRGLVFYVGAAVQEIAAAADGLQVRLETEAGGQEITADMVIDASGRVPSLDVLGESLAGAVVNSAGWLCVSDRLETSVTGLYAAGDVTGPPLLANLAYAQGMVAAENALGFSSRLGGRAIPYFLGTVPEVAWVGLTESEVARRGWFCRSGKFPFAANGCAQVHGRAEGFVKIVTLEDGTVAGMQILGGPASELIMEGVLAIENKLSFHDLARTIHPHPTFAEAVWEAGLTLGAGGQIWIS